MIVGMIQMFSLLFHFVQFSFLFEEIEIAYKNNKTKQNNKMWNKIIEFELQFIFLFLLFCW